MISLGPGKMNIDIFSKLVMGNAILTKIIGLVNKTLSITFFQKNIFTESALRADSVRESKCLSVCVSVCVKFMLRPLIGPQVT